MLGPLDRGSSFPFSVKGKSAPRSVQFDFLREDFQVIVDSGVLQNKKNLVNVLNGSLVNYVI